MLLPNRTIWETRIQSVDALLTASAGGRDEVYYLATACQVSIDPPRISVSPNPEYAICATIESAGRFGLNLVAEEQSDLIERCVALDRDDPDKLARLDVAHERTAHGTPLLVDCLQSLELEVERAWTSGDHRTIIARVVDRRVRPRAGSRRPHRFRGGAAAGERLVKQMLCRTRLYDLFAVARGRHRQAMTLLEGTREYMAPAGDAIEVAGGRSAGRAGRAGREPGQEQEHIVDRVGGDAMSHETDEAERRERMPLISSVSSPPGICLVGCGWWGSVHALELARLGGRVRRFFASRNAERAREFSRRFQGEAAFDGLEAALADPRVDAVVLALPHDLHAAAARAALDAGKHVLVEKPLALRLDDAAELVDLARQRGLCLAVAEQYRLSPLVRRAREVIAGGELGRIGLVACGAVSRYRPRQDWKTRRETMGGGVALDVGVHYVDVLRSWFGDPERVWAGAPPSLQTELEGEDAISAGLVFPGGPIATLQLSWSGFRSPDAPNFELIGERGALALWFRRSSLELCTPLGADHWSGRLRRVLPWQIEERLRGRLPQARRRRLPVAGGDLIGSGALILDFVDAITSGRPPAVPGEEGRRDLAVVLALERACRTGEPATPEIIAGG